MEFTRITLKGMLITGNKRLYKRAGSGYQGMQLVGIQRVTSYDISDDRPQDLPATVEGDSYEASPNNALIHNSQHNY